ncbi:MAG: hypothetical protein ACFFD4_39615 [Candidatus Odinarchaeota archaeon]
MRFLCQNGHNWNARKLKPVKCRYCGNTNLFNIDFVEINPSSFTVQAVNDLGFVVAEARVQVREAVPMIEQLQEEQEGVTIKVTLHAGNESITGRMGVAVPEGASVKGINLTRSKKPKEYKLMIGDCRVSIVTTFKHSTSITRYGKGKIIGDLTSAAKKRVLDIHEVKFTFLKRVDGLPELTKQQKKMYKRKWLNPLKKCFTAAGGMILFTEIFPAIED